MSGFGSTEGDYSLQIDCTIANTTIVPMGCGSVVTGSTVGLPNIRGDIAGDKQHLFCPNTTATARVSTCGSTFRTQLHTNGPDVDITKFEFGSGCDNDDAVTFDFEAGECYDILLGGWSTWEGDYVLSMTCGISSKPIEVECGSNVLGSTDVFLGIQPFLFCSSETKRVEASTCGSNFATSIRVNGTIRDFGCSDCPSDSRARCIGFNARWEPLH